MIRIRLTYQEVEQLHDCHLWKELQGSDPHTLLLHEHCRELTLRLEKLVDKQCKRYTMSFTSLQALAFLQLWTDQELPRTPAAIAILQIIEFIDQAKITLNHENDRKLAAGSAGTTQI